jgi:hypothetical protein
VVAKRKLLALQGQSLAMAVDQGGLNVFISYSRDDLAFADQLRVALQGFGFGVTIDRDDITGGDAWKKRLSDLIRDADTVVFVLSPSSADSPTCAWDGKRILPVLCRALDGANPPPELAALNYMYFYSEPKFPGSGFGKGLHTSPSHRISIYLLERYIPKNVFFLREEVLIYDAPESALHVAPRVADLLIVHHCVRVPVIWVWPAILPSRGQLIRALISDSM